MTIASLIVDVAANTVKLTKDVDSINNKLGSIEKLAGNVGKALAGAFTVTAIVGAAKEVVDFASHLTDLSQKTGISTTGLQKLQLAFEQSGIALDTVTTATAKLAKNVVGGDQSAVGALTKLGIPIAELKKMSPEDQFIRVADAIGRIQNPTEKSYAAMAIFGKGGAELLAGLDGHLKETTAKFEAMGIIIDEKTIAAADDFGDQMGVLQKIGMAFLATVLAPLLPGLAKLAEWLMRVGSGAIELAKSVEDWLITAWLNAGISFDKFLLSVAEGSQKIPLLGKYIGASAETVAGLRENVATSELQLKLFTTRTAEAGEATKKTHPTLLGLGDDMVKAAAAAKKLHEELEKHTDAVHKIEAGFFGLRESVGQADDRELKFVRTSVELHAELAKVEQAAHIANFGFKGMADGLENVGRKVDLLPDVLHQFVGPMRDGAQELAVSFGDQFKADLRGSLGGMNAIFQSAFEGGGGVKGAVSSLATKLTSNALKLIPVVGETLSQFAGAIVAGVKKLFGGVSQAELDARKQVQGFEAQLSSTLTATQKLEAGNTQWKMTTIAVRDAYLATGRSEAEAQAAVERLWSSSRLGAEATKKAIDDINAVLQEQAADQQRAKELIDEYKISIDQLGPAFRQQQLDDQAKQLMNDFRIMVTVLGIETPQAIGLMSTKINAYVHDAIRTGTEVPASMQPMLQKMIDMGVLTDENGVAITDLKTSGITFAETLTQGIDRIVGKFDELMTKLFGVGNAINALPTGHTTVLTTVHDDVYTRHDGANYAARGGLVTTSGIQYFGTGGPVLPFVPRGSDTVPAMLTPGELVLSRREARAYMAGGGSLGDLRAVREELRLARLERRREPERIALAVAGALATRKAS